MILIRDVARGINRTTEPTTYTIGAGSHVCRARMSASGLTSEPNITPQPTTAAKRRLRAAAVDHEPKRPYISENDTHAGMMMVTAARVAALFLIISDATTATPTPIADAHGALSTVTLTIRQAAVTSGVYGWMLGSLGCRGGMGWGLKIGTNGVGKCVRCWINSVGN